MKNCNNFHDKSFKRCFISLKIKERCFLQLTNGNGKKRPTLSDEGFGDYFWNEWKDGNAFSFLLNYEKDFTLDLFGIWNNQEWCSILLMEELVPIKYLLKSLGNWIFHPSLLTNFLFPLLVPIFRILTWIGEKFGSKGHQFNLPFMFSINRTHQLAAQEPY